ncbi:MAG: ankyrin repeat domain-containing protein [Candidatus Babeliales bacterium]
MSVSKQITLVLSLFCVTLPICAMHSDIVNKQQLDRELLAAVRSDFAEEVRALLERGADIECRDVLSDCTPLHIAAENGHTKTVKELLSKGAYLEALDAQESATPLHKAVAKGHIETISELLAAGARTEARDILFRTPLQLAVLGDDAESVTLLLSHGADKEARQAGGITSLHSAVRRNHKGVLKALLDAGADRGAKDQFHRIPLCFALDFEASGDVETIRMLLHHPQCSIKGSKQASRKRIFAALCCFARNLVPHDVQLKLLSYMPEDTLNQEHARLLLNCETNIEELAAYCPLEWFVAMYQDKKYKEEFLEKIVAAVVTHRLSIVRHMVADAQVQRLVQSHNPIVRALLDPHNVEQHREAIAANVRTAFVRKEMNVHGK